MQGIVNRAIQCFVLNTYGRSVWVEVCKRAGLGFTNFEAMLDYDPGSTERVLSSVEIELNRPISSLLEDLGTFLVTHRSTEVVRRLLRFGGNGFEEFILSLDELPERANLALADLQLPEITLRISGNRQFKVLVGDGLSGFSWVLIGVVRAMADDYGALAMIDHGQSDGRDCISISLAEDSFLPGRMFELSPVKYATG